MIDAEMIYRTVGVIVKEKRRKGIHPDVATSREVAAIVGTGTAAIEDIARHLMDAGMISIGRGLNYDYYRIRDDAKTD